MKHIDFEFNGETYALSFTADALFRVYDKCGGAVDNIFEALHITEPTEEGWTNLCWLAALLSAQGEYQRRHMGDDPRPMLKLEDLRTGLMAGESIRLRKAVAEAIQQGFEYTPKEQPEEIDEVLKAREEAEKKTNLFRYFEENIWQRHLRSSGSL